MSQLPALQPDLRPAQEARPVRDGAWRPQPSFPELAVKTIVVHTVTYFGVGLLALTLLDYATLFAEPEMRPWLRQTNDPLVALGPALQPLRGLLFAVAFYPLRESLFGRRYGWLTLWLLLMTVGIFSTFGPTPGSIEGLIYTTLPPWRQLGGLAEVLLQSLLLATLLCYWVNHPRGRWMSWLLGGLFLVAVLLSVAGFVVARAAARAG
jgi:hypothetical protein